MTVAKYIPDNLFLFSEWNHEKNAELGYFAESTSLGNSKKKCWWTCSVCGREWQSIPSNRKKGSGCPDCGKQKSKRSRQLHRLTEDGSFEDWCHNNGLYGSQLLSEWDYDSNKAYQPNTLTKGSNITVVWKCFKGHTWNASIYNRVTGSGCPVCSNRRVVSGINDLATTHPELLIDWDYEKNGELLPTMLTYGSEKQVWWKCPTCGNNWQISPNARTSTTCGCPYCAHNKIDPNRTSLAATNPDVALEWDYEHNGNLTPETVFPQSKMVVWWKCQICSHSWQASIGSRSKGTVCPHCTARVKTSFPEQAIYYYIKQLHPDAQMHYKDIFTHSMELDIFIPSLSLGIEYDGQAWHSSPAAEKRECRKYAICQTHGIKLIRIKESANDSSPANCDVLISAVPAIRDKHLLDKTLDKLSVYIPLPSSHDCIRDENTIKSSFYSTVWKNSLSAAAPELLSEWHYAKNSPLTPDMFFISSGQKVWWICEQGHEWQSEIYSRTKGHKCPYCSNLKAWKGFNDLASLDPDLAISWDIDKNGVLSPDSVVCTSNKRIWWRCKKCNHSWKTSVYNRYKKRTGCPVCSNNVAKAGHNDFATTHPILASEWDYAKNDTLLPSMFVAGSTKRIWWLCKNGHSWQAAIATRVRGNNCPFCSNKAVLSGYNDFATIHPELLEEWDYSRNTEITPTSLSYGSGKQVWWVCKKCGHNWKAALYSRSSGRGCTKCASQLRGSRKEKK